MATTMTTATPMRRMYKFYTIVIEPNFHTWRDKNPDEEPVREMKIKLSATDIADAQAKVWKAVNLDQETYEIVSIYTDGYFNRYHSRYGDTED